MKLFIFGASFRKDSYNQKLARNAAEIFRGHEKVSHVEYALFKQFEMPLYDGDLEDASDALPKGAQAFIDQIEAASAVVISTPEYNGSIPGTLKNAIDWASRAEKNPFAGKPILLLAASPGGLGGVRSLWHTRVPLEVLGAFVFPEMFGLAKAHEAFDEKDVLKDEKAVSRLRKLATEFLKFAE